MLALLCTFAVASSSVVAYNDQLIAIQRRNLDATDRIVGDQLPSNAAELEAFRLDLRGVVQGYVIEVRATPPYQGDAQLRDTLAEDGEKVLALIDHEVLDFYAVVGAAEVHDADVDRVERDLALLDASVDALDERDAAAQRAFAARWHLVIRDSDQPVEPVAAEFDAPGLVPAGSHISPGLMAALTTRYLNGFIQDHNDLLDATNKYLEAGSGASEAARVATVETIRTLMARTRARGPWRGDAGALEATLGLEAAYEGLFTREAAFLIKRDEGGLRTRQQVDAYNELVRSLNEGMARGAEAEARQREAFRSRWALPAYDAWRDEQAAQRGGDPPVEPVAPSGPAPDPVGPPP